MSETYTLRNVRDGKPFTADEMPKLPPRAMKKMLDVLRAFGVDPNAKLDMEDPNTIAAMSEVAVVLVHATARRMDRSVTLDDIGDDEDMEEILRVFGAVKKRNPLFFPEGTPDVPAPKMAEDPVGSDPS